MAENSTSSYLDQRRTLSKSITRLRVPQRLYIPGSGPLLDAINPVLLAMNPEDVALWLPSSLPSISRDTQCVDGLPLLEFQLRYAQAANALHEIRTSCRLKRALGMKTRVHIADTQKTRNQSLYDNVSTKLTRAVSTYRVAWNAIANLAPNEELGRWKDALQELRTQDIRGPGRETAEPSTSQHVPSWIWTSTPHLSTSPSIEDPDLHAVLRMEWCKAQERARRYEEEVELVIEEMRRTLVTMEWDAREWESLATCPAAGAVAINLEMVAGIVAYAYKQANIRREMAKTFVDDWYHLLEQHFPNLSWLKQYPRPPETKRRRLVSNVQRYHPGSYGSQVDLPDDDAIPSDSDDVDSGPPDATIDIEDFEEY